MRLGRITQIAAILCLVAACDKPDAGAGAQAEKAHRQKAGIITVSAAPAKLTVELPGRVVSPMVSEVRPQVGGIITQRLFDEGSDVTEGQLLYEIDPATYKAALASAEADLAKARANATSLRLKAQRYKELIAINAVSKQDYDDAVASMEAAEAEIAADEAAVETARINLNYTKIRAPISGRIGKSSVTPGALVTASQTTALATIQQLDPVFIDLSQSTDDYMRMKKRFASGDAVEDSRIEVRITFADGLDYKQTGVLQSSDISVTQTTSSVALRAVLPNPDIDLLPGMYVRAVLDAGVVASAIRVPQAAVTRDRKGKATALVVGSGDKVEKRDLTIDRIVGNEYLVTAGLKAGDRLIVDGLQKVKVGMAVEPVKASESIASVPKSKAKSGGTSSDKSKAAAGAAEAGKKSAGAASPAENSNEKPAQKSGGTAQ